MTIRILQHLLLLPALGLIAATVESAPPITAATVSISPADKASYYSIRPDRRRCISPLCGGYFISAVNKKRTRCADGSHRQECYVAEIQWDHIGLPGEQGAALVLGVQYQKKFRRFGALGVLVPKAAWRAARESSAQLSADRAKGRWYGLSHTGIVCVAAPCYNIEERLLNLKRKREQLISGVDLTKVNAESEDMAAAMHLLRKDELIAVGKNIRIPNEGPAGDGVTLEASQFYLPLKVRNSDPLYCEVDADCTLSVYHSLVQSKDECYCPLCPQPINADAAKKNEASWLRYCHDFGFSLRDENSATLRCPQVLCTQPPPVDCVNNQCVGLDERPWPFELLSH